jgi:hypothetical protein
VREASRRSNPLLNGEIASQSALALTYERRRCGGAVVKKGMVMAGKYTPLENYLRDLPESQREVTLGFAQIERILNDKLPSSAHEYKAWWANEKEGNHVNARSWSNAGWKVESLDFNEKWVKLIRIG